MLPALRLLGDEPSEQDALGYQPYVTAVANGIKGAGDGSFVVGIFGPWGTGKSTFLSLLKPKLQSGGADARVIRFSPWQYDDSHDVWKAFLGSVLRSLNGGATLASRALLARLDEIASQVVFNQLLKVDARTFEVDLDTQIFVDRFRERFAKERNRALGRRKLVVFVDDLDRCTPETCMVVLHAIKVFFDARSCVFVLAIDDRLVQQGVLARHSDVLEFDGHEYLAKMVQLSCHLPSISDDSFCQYIKSCMDRIWLDGQSLCDFLGNAGPFVTSMVKTAADRNPRAAKRVLNAIAVALCGAHETIAKWSDEPETWKTRVSLLTTLQLHDPLAFRSLRFMPECYPLLLDRSESRERERVHEDFQSRLAIAAAGKTSGARFIRFWQILERLAPTGKFENSTALERYLRLTTSPQYSPPPDQNAGGLRRIRALFRRCGQFVLAGWQCVPRVVRLALGRIACPPAILVADLVHLLRAAVQRFWGAPYATLLVDMPRWLSLGAATLLVGGALATYSGDSWAARLWAPVCSSGGLFARVLMLGEPCTTEEGDAARMRWQLHLERIASAFENEQKEAKGSDANAYAKAASSFGHTARSVPADAAIDRVIEKVYEDIGNSVPGSKLATGRPVATTLIRQQAKRLAGGTGERIKRSFELLLRAAVFGGLFLLIGVAPSLALRVRESAPEQ